MISRFILLSASVLGVACSGSEGQAPATESAGGAPSAPLGVAGAVATPPSGAGGAASTVPQASGGVPTTPVVGAGGAMPVGGSPPIVGSGGQTVVAPPGAGGAPVVASGGASAAGAGGEPAVDPPGTGVIDSDTFTVDPGGEVFKCQNFNNPFGGKDTDVQHIASDITQGSHHLHLYNLTEGTSLTIEDCPGTDFHALVHASGRPHDDTVYPAGMATKVRGASGMRIQLHYLNTTPDPLPGHATIKLYPVADPTTVTKWVASLYFNRVFLTVPPGQGQIVNTTCSVPADYGAIGLVWGVSHMHSRGVHFVAKTSTGTTLTDDTNWNEPTPTTYEPPVMLNPADSINWTCTYNNNTGMTLTFGDSAATNEMCIYVARYYSLNSNDVQITCQSPSDQGGTAFLQSD